jgi:hypothetical protein
LFQFPWTSQNAEREEVDLEPNKGLSLFQLLSTSQTAELNHHGTPED